MSIASHRALGFLGLKLLQFDHGFSAFARRLRPA